MAGEGTVRVDAWVWAVRLAKTRSQAGAACRAGHVRVNDVRVKPAQPVRVGDVIRVRTTEHERIVTVVTLLTKRVGPTVAVTAYTDQSPPLPPREERAVRPIRDRGSGRPTKRDRREMDRLRGR